MRIHKLILNNVGLFRGRNEIELLPRTKYGKTRPVVLIGGTNGAGKTTILDSIRLCLYGPLALGERVSQDEYHRYLRGCVHRDDSQLVKLESASVGLEFEFGLGGRLDKYYVERNWDCNSTVSTCLTVKRNGKLLDGLEAAHADEFLRDLIPRGVSQLFFFDGEKIQEMAQAADDDITLTHSIRELLGLDMVSRLKSDLSVYSAKFRESHAPKAIQKELKKIDDTRNRLLKDQFELIRTLDQKQSKEDRIRKEIDGIESRLSRSGGSFATRRESLKAEETELKNSIDEVEKTIRELAGDLLPFTLAIQLCEALKTQLLAESKLRDWQAHQSLLQDQISRLRSTIHKQLFPKSEQVDVDDAFKKRIKTRVRGMLDELTKPSADFPEVELTHNLLSDEQTRLLDAISRVLKEVPKQVNELEQRYEKRMRRLLRVKSELEKVPEDDIIEPLLKKLNELNRKLGKAESATKRAKEELTSLEHELEVSRRQREKKEEALKQAQKGTERDKMVEKVQAVLEDYAAELTLAKMSDLSEAVAECFSQLWRKGDSLHKIKIDPDTSSVMLLDKNDNLIPKDRLSAGEKQVYAISMLWALAKVSGRVLPMVIDTPLARLDSKHRRHLVTRYFPHVSHQVIILSTDTEIDQSYFEDLGPSISHAYHLSYNESDACTEVEEGYFWGRRKTEATS